MIQDVLTARSLREDPEAARNVLKGYAKGIDSFVDYGLIEIEIAAAGKALFSQNSALAQQLLEGAEALLADSLRRYGVKGALPALEAEIQWLRGRLDEA